MIRGGRRPWRFRTEAVASGLAITLLSAVFSPAAKAQQEVELSLGSDLSIPGGDAYLPLTFFAKGVAVGKVLSEVSFPKKTLSFVEARRGEAGNQAEAEVKAEVKEAGENSDLSVVRVAISASQPLPDGLLATLKFKVSGSAPESDIKLKNVVKLTSLNGKEIKGAKGNEAILTISPPTFPSVGCFIFTH